MLYNLYKYGNISTTTATEILDVLKSKLPKNTCKNLLIKEADDGKKMQYYNYIKYRKGDYNGCKI